MSFFRPHKSKPRQFNYIPRHYDPVKEEREQRRKELHGTSSEDDEQIYTPGKYIRTQRDARDAAREESANGSTSKMRNMTLMMVIIALFALIVVPRFIKFADMVREEKEAEKAKQEQMRKKVEFTEELEGIDNIDNVQVFMQGLTEKEAWQRSNNVTFEGQEMQQLQVEILNILSEEMAGSSTEEMEAALQEAMEDPERWLKEHGAKSAQ